MKHILHLFILLVCLGKFQTTHAQCMMYPVSLKQRTLNAETIFVGKLKEKRSYFDEERRGIYTLNIMEVLAYLKGGSTKTTIAVITEGGVVEDQAQITIPSLEIESYNEYLLFIKGDNFLIDNKAYRQQYPDVVQAEAYASSQGAITRQFGLYHDLYAEPVATEKDLFRKIEGLTGKAAKDPFGKTFEPRAVERPPHVTRPITSFNPSSTHAGTIDPADFITISGSGFGAAAGTIFYTNADDGGATFITTGVASDNVSWSDIAVLNKVARGAGTGPINVNGAMTSAGNLTIDYSHLNINSTFSGFGTSTRQRYYLRNINGSGGYTFVYNTTSGFSTNTPAVEAFERALESWRCSVFVNFDAGGTTANLFANDGESVVCFDGALPLGVLARATSRFSGSANGGCNQANTVWYLSEVDIQAMPDPPAVGFPWNYGPGATLFTQYDFESVLLHELGHALGLGHTIAPAEVMHFSISNGQDKRTLAANEITGGVAKMLYSTAATCFNPAGSGTPMVALAPGTCALVLPVQLSEFTAFYNEHSASTQLHWHTASEKNSLDFEVQHSSDGNIFTTIGTLAAAGNSQISHEYSFDHTNPAPGKQYYRLKQNDIDGKSHYSQVVAVIVPFMNQLTIIPNPVHNELLLHISPLQEAVVVVYNSIGQEVYTMTNVMAPSLKIATTEWADGLYYIKVQQGADVTSGRFQVKH